MLRLIGRAADGVLPSLSYLPGGAADYAGLNRHIDDSAAQSGRDPRRIRRLLNINGTFSALGRSFLDGPAEQWAEDLAQPDPRVRRQHLHPGHRRPRRARGVRHGRGPGRPGAGRRRTGQQFLMYQTGFQSYGPCCVPSGVM
nr:hypothetical protein GCM10020092_074320 [Actinoplanes digitatis]